MARTIGYILGGLALLDGIVGIAMPRQGFDLWKRRFRGNMPEPLDRIANDYSRLPTPAVQALGVWSLTLGAVMVWLAGRARD